MSAAGVEPFLVWDQENLPLFVPPLPDRETGQWVTIKQLRDLFDAHGRSYVQHIQPEWAAPDHSQVFDALEARLAQMKDALNCGDHRWAEECWRGLVKALASVHPDANALLGDLAHSCPPTNEHGLVTGF